MPFTVKIGRKPPKFERDLPTYNITVKGPTHLFTEKVENWLFVQGLNRLDSSSTFETWSTRYNIGAPPLYIAAFLKHKYSADLDLDTRKLLAAAVEEFDDKDGLDSILGTSAKISNGNRKLAIISGTVDYVANCSEENHARQDLLAGAGWIPVPNPTAGLIERFGSKPYRTRDPLIASNLQQFMNKPTLERLGKALAKFKRNIRKSHTQQVPENFTVPVPEGLDYLPFQKGGIQMILDEGKGGILADDMGLGKTVQGIGILNGRPQTQRMLIVCQANMRLKWVEEIEKWKVERGLTVGHAEGDKFPDTDIVVINYDIAKRHEEKLRAVDWDIILADEAHNMKNEETNRTQAVLGTLSLDRTEAGFIDTLPLSQDGILVHLTGTPKPNKIADLWPLLTTSRPDIWGRGPEARRAFLNRYEPPVLIKKKMRKDNREFDIIVPLAGKPIREEELQMRLRGSGSFIRRMKRDTDLPPKFRTSIPLPYALTEEDQLALKRNEEEFAELAARVGRIRGRDIKARTSGKASEIIDTITGVAPNGIEFHEIARIRSNLGQIKAPLVARFVIDELKEDDELPVELRRKTVIFAHHKPVIARMREMIEAEYPGGVLVYDGSVTSAKKKQSIVDKFQTDPKSRVIILSRSGNTGITLTAAFRMRVAEPDWDPGNMLQIEDRIWRIGQEVNCDIGYLFMPNSLDIKIGKSLMSKMETDERATNTISKRALRKRPGEEEKQDPFESHRPKKRPVVEESAQAEFAL